MAPLLEDAANRLLCRAGQTIFSGGLVAGTDEVNGSALGLAVPLSNGYQGMLPLLCMHASIVGVLADVPTPLG